MAMHGGNWFLLGLLPEEDSRLDDSNLGERRLWLFEKAERAKNNSI